MSPSYVSQLGTPSPFPFLRFPFICLLSSSRAVGCSLHLPLTLPRLTEFQGMRAEGPRQFSEDLFHLWNAKPLGQSDRSDVQGPQAHAVSPHPMLMLVAWGLPNPCVKSRQAVICACFSST